MKALLFLSLAIELSMFSTSKVAHAFQINPSGIGISDLHGSYPRLPKIVKAQNSYSKSTSRVCHYTSVPTNQSENNHVNRERFVRRLFRRFSSFLKHPKKLLHQIYVFAATLALVFLINFSALPASATSSNGRMSGSYGRADRYSSPSISRSVRSSNAEGKTRIPARAIYAPRRPYRNRNYRNFHKVNGEQLAGDGTSIMTSPGGTRSYVRKVNTHPFANSRFSASDIVFVSSATAIITNSVVRRRSDRKKYNDDDPSLHPLGPGISVWHMTACLNVSNLNDSKSIVRRMQRIADNTSTLTRKGLQKILAETSLELLRQLEKGSLASVNSQYHWYRSSDQAVVRAERQYNRVSTRERSKFDGESWSSDNGEIFVDDEDQEVTSDPFTTEDKPSLALVQIHVIIEGNALQPYGERQMETASMFRNALLQLSGDLSAVEDCVLSGEVLWAPQTHKKNQVLTEEDIYASHPNLWPVDYSII